MTNCWEIDSFFAFSSFLENRFFSSGITTNCSDWHIFRIPIVLSGRTKFSTSLSVRSSSTWRARVKRNPLVTVKIRVSGLSWARNNVALMYALESAHVYSNVWIEVELCPFYWTGAIQKNDNVDPNTNVPIVSNSDVELYMYLTATLGSVDVKFMVWTGPASETFLRFICVDDGKGEKNRNCLDKDKRKTRRNYLIQQRDRKQQKQLSVWAPWLTLWWLLLVLLSQKNLLCWWGLNKYVTWQVSSTKVFILFCISNSIFIVLAQFYFGPSKLLFKYTAMTGLLNLEIRHVPVPFCLCVKTSLSVKETIHMKMSVAYRFILRQIKDNVADFEAKARGNSEMACFPFCSNNSRFVLCQCITYARDYFVITRL